MVLEVQARHPGNCKVPQSVSGGAQRQKPQPKSKWCKSGTEPRPTSQWREERNKATRVRGQREEHGSDDALAEQRSTSRREKMMKSRQKSIANSRQKSIANGRQDKSRANGRKSNLRATSETRRSTRRITRRSTIQSKAAAIQPASRAAFKNRCRCPAGTGRSDHCSEAATRKVQKIVKDSHDDSQFSSTA